MILCNKGLFIRGVRKNLDKIIPLLFFPQNDRAVSTPFSFFTQSSKYGLLGKGLKGAVATYGRREKLQGKPCFSAL